MTVEDLLVGSEFKFDDKGETALRDIPGLWRIYTVGHGGIDTMTGLGIGDDELKDRRRPSQVDPTQNSFRHFQHRQGSDLSGGIDLESAFQLLAPNDRLRG